MNEGFEQDLPGRRLLSHNKAQPIEDMLALSRKEFNKYISDHKDNLSVTAENLKKRWLVLLPVCILLTTKCLRDLIQ